MKDVNPLLLTDYYKTTHHAQYPEGTEYIVSYFVPRMSRLQGIDKIVNFGLQGVIKEYLLEGFRKNFFDRDEEEVINEYKNFLAITLGEKPAKDAAIRVRELHQLRYSSFRIVFSSIQFFWNVNDSSGVY